MNSPREILIAWASSGGFAAVHNAGATDAQIVDDLLKWLAKHGLRIANDWQPIETAPRDEPIIGFGLWAGEINGQVYPDPECLMIQYAPGGDYPGFDWAVCGTDTHAAWMKPTLWQRLTPPDPSHG
jgi:hypothetical protein